MSLGRKRKGNQRGVSIIASPLRYPGGKSKALKEIFPLIPEFDEYREPMAGGASVFFAIKQACPNKKYWINEKNKDLYLFWKFCKEDPVGLVAEIRRMRGMFRGSWRGKRLYRYLMDKNLSLSDIQLAARFFVLNRITFSGLVDTGGYSHQAFSSRFTESSIERITKASETLKNVTITNYDYKSLLEKNGRNVFVFLDPPYMSKKYAELYGKRGVLHKSFDHQLFFKNVKACKHQWLITYDKCSGIEEIYKFAESVGWHKKEWKLQYGTNNLNPVERQSSRKGEELFIYNYAIKSNRSWLK
jgi:DNA adenine methylase